MMLLISVPTIFQHNRVSCLSPLVLQVVFYMFEEMDLNFPLFLSTHYCVIMLYQISIK
jgi:hypothetical protein